jgi:4-hydroxy-tetrahydrodipicolinate reductase
MMRAFIHGHGKMGRAVEEALASRGFECAGIFDEARPLPEKLDGGDVVIDFSHAAALDRLFDVALRSGVDLVIGTTGWNDRAGEFEQKIGQKIGVVYASNFSPGANILFALARRAGELFATQSQYSAGIEERHHDQKKDAPSGTALRLARAVEEGSGGAIKPPITASRVGKEFGLHTLFFDSEDDLIELSHRARGRNGFARGAVLAAELVRGKKGLFRFEELAGF